MMVEQALCQRAGEGLNQNLTPNNEVGMNIDAEGGWSGTVQILINNKFLLRKAFDIL